MSKYYKAEDVIRAIEEMQNCYNGWSDTYDKAQIIGVLEELPTIEVREGAWITACNSYEIICSNCESEAFSEDGEYVKTNFCPNCGAGQERSVR